MGINDTKIGGVSPTDVPKQYKLSKACLIMGILSLCLLPIFSLPAIITGIIASTKEKAAKKFYTPGIITGVISLVLAIIFAILIRLLLGWLGLSFKDFSSIDAMQNINTDMIFDKLPKWYL